MRGKPGHIVCAILAGFCLPGGRCEAAAITQATADVSGSGCSQPHQTVTGTSSADALAFCIDFLGMPGLPPIARAHASVTGLLPSGLESTLTVSASDQAQGIGLISFGSAGSSASAGLANTIMITGGNGHGTASYRFNVTGSFFANQGSAFDMLSVSHGGVVRSASVCPSLPLPSPILGPCTDEIDLIGPLDFTFGLPFDVSAALTLNAFTEAFGALHVVSGALTAQLTGLVVRDDSGNLVPGVAVQIVQPVPEPSSFILAALGLIGLAVGARRPGTRISTGVRERDEYTPGPPALRS